MEEPRYRLMLVLQDENDCDRLNESWCIVDYSSIEESDDKDALHRKLSDIARQLRHEEGPPIDIEADSKVNAIRELETYLNGKYGNYGTLLGCKSLIDEVVKHQQHDKAKQLLDKVKSTYVVTQADGSVMTLNGSEVMTLKRLLATEMNNYFGAAEKTNKTTINRLRAPITNDDWVANDDPRLEPDPGPDKC